MKNGYLCIYLPFLLSGAYCGFMMLALLSKIEEIDTFNATNLHQTAVKSYLNYHKYNALY